MSSLRYFGSLFLKLGWSIPTPGRRAMAGSLVLAVLIGSAAVYGGEQAVGAEQVESAHLEDRIAHIGSLLDEVELVYAAEVAPIERVLLTYRSDDPQLIRRVAVSLVREAHRTELEPRLLLAVLLVENPWIDPEISSFAGAQGLMQVMPFHRGNWAPCEPRLDDVEANICHGASIFASYLKSTNGDLDRALLRYNGCVNGTNTPNCHQYPTHVFARAGRASILAAWHGNAAGAMGASR
ncbi:hypothetical protein BH23GEM10_BH23GEM10_13540 [soil metagenome]